MARNGHKMGICYCHSFILRVYLVNLVIFVIPEDCVKITGSIILGLIGNTRIIFVKKVNKMMFKIIVAEISMLLILSSLSSFDISLSAL
jgi:hypothetical protein